MIVAIYAKEHNRAESATVIDYVEMTSEQLERERRALDAEHPLRRNEAKWEILQRYPKARQFKHLAAAKLD